MNFDIFKNQKDRAECVTAMERLLADPAWKFLTRVFDHNASIIRSNLETKDDFKNLEEVYGLQGQLAFVENCKDLPKDLLKEARNLPPAAADEEAYD